MVKNLATTTGVSGGARCGSQQSTVASSSDCSQSRRGVVARNRADPVFFTRIGSGNRLRSLPVGIPGRLGGNREFDAAIGDAAPLPDYRPLDARLLIASVDARRRHPSFLWLPSLFCRYYLCALVCPSVVRAALHPPKCLLSMES